MVVLVRPPDFVGGCLLLSDLILLVMLDTVRLKIWGLSDLTFDGTTTMQEIAVDKDDMVRVLRYPETGRFVPLVEAQKLPTRSSHYTATCRINLLADYLTIDFSLPKTLYGTNVFQFVNHRRIVSPESAEVEYSLATLYELFVKQVSSLLTFWFRCDIPLYRIEVTRLDFCFNAHFNSEEDANTYFDALRDLRKKYARIANESFSHFQTSVFFKTKTHSFKVYKKGVEFRKDDAPKLRQFNQQVRPLFRVGDIQKEANKVLRYELTARASWISDRVHEYMKELRPGLYKLSKKDEKLTRRRFRVFLGLSDQERISNYQAFSLRDHSYCVRLNSRIMEACFLRFWAIVKQFRVKSLSLPEMLLVIEEYNKTAKYKQKLGSQFIAFCAFVNSGESFDTIQQMGVFPRSTFYQYRKIFIALFKENVTKKFIFAENDALFNFFAYKNFSKWHIAA